ncbi:TRAP transporter small permease [Psychromarinibacter sp. S121]|uniref:TRAP transporter small permease n=1 Tax=Psychromarinibacter sp. S121 TaxID=3415127 RepID=UPI003C7AA8AA
MLASTLRAWSVYTGRATLVLGWVAGLLLVLMTALITAAVIMRYAVGQPILGVNEIVQLNAVALAMLALPYATYSGAHVRADIFDPALGRWGRWLADLLTRAVSVGALYFLVTRAWDKALDAREFGDATNMLNLPIWPFYGLIALGMALCVLVFVLEFATILLTGHPKGEFPNG